MLRASKSWKMFSQSHVSAQPPPGKTLIKGMEKQKERLKCKVTDKALLHKYVCVKLNPFPVRFPGNQCHLWKPKFGAPTLTCQCQAPHSSAPLFLCHPEGESCFHLHLVAIPRPLCLCEQISVPTYAGITCCRRTKVGGRWKGGHCPSQDHWGPGRPMTRLPPQAETSWGLTFMVETIGRFWPGMYRHLGPWRDMCLCFDVPHCCLHHFLLLNDQSWF